MKAKMTAALGKKTQVAAPEIAPVVAPEPIVVTKASMDMSSQSKL
jgi:hypothetical protein